MSTPGRDWPFGGRPGRWRGRPRALERLPRWRTPDPWGDAAEAYPGAAALAEAAERSAGEGAAESAGAWSAAAARLAVIELALETARRPVAPALLAEARAAAAEQVRAGGCGAAETAALAAAVGLAAPDPPAALAEALCAAGSAAAATGQPGGAASLWRAAYALATPRRWESGAAWAAAGLEELARAAGSRRGTRLWRARALRHARRAAA